LKQQTAHKILLLVPAESASGGIKNYFSVLKDEFTLPVEYMIRGARTWPHRKGPVAELKRFRSDYRAFKHKLATGDYSLVQTSTSLGLFSVIRDGLYIRKASKNGLKTVVFFRGWNKNFERKLENYFLRLFRTFFFRADLFIVLSPDFKQKLQQWGYKKEILVETTLIDQKLLEGIDLEAHMAAKNASGKNINILFLARTEIAKGLYEAIESFRIVRKNNPNHTVTLTIAGDGKEWDNMNRYLADNGVENVFVAGHVSGPAKAKAFLDADIYLFPSYSEGMPNSVLEAMSFGLPVVATTVGGIPFIIENGINGFTTPEAAPEILAGLVQRLIDNKDLRHSMGIANSLKAKEAFYSDKVVRRMEQIYTRLLQDNKHTK
jgi:glycosyltransferase involved in cell wall biosynthesis